MTDAFMYASRTQRDMIYAETWTSIILSLHNSVRNTFWPAFVNTDFFDDGVHFKAIS